MTDLTGCRYSHGFIYPSTIQEIRKENVTGLSPLELDYRGGPKWAPTYSSVSRFGEPYIPPFANMSPGQQVEALVEGSELSLLSRLNILRHHPKASGRRDNELSGHTKEGDFLQKLYERRMTIKERYLRDEQERGGTVLVHFIKRDEWFRETAEAFLGDD